MNHTWRNLFSIIKNCILILLLSIVTGFLLLLAVYQLPTGPIRTHIRESLPLLQEEGLYPQKYPHIHSQLDNWTDSLILNAAGYEDDRLVWEQALLNSHYSLDMEDTVDSIQNLAAAYGGEDSSTCSSTAYPRYWHGYLVYIKPLLSIFNYETIRVVNTILQYLLTAVVAFLLIRKKRTDLLLPYLIAWGFLLPPVIGASLQFSSIFYIFTLGALILLECNDHWQIKRTHIYYFFLLGIITSYMDFLTYPLATLGIPLVLYFVLKPDDSFRSDLMDLIRYPIFWGLGYIGMWTGKWFLASLLTDENVILDAIQAVQIRSSSAVSGEAITWLDVIFSNLRCILTNPFTWLGVFYALLLLFLRIHQRNGNWKRIPIWGAIILSPFLWYIVTGNHSFVHYWFTCKALVISVFAGMAAFLAVKTHPD